MRHMLRSNSTPACGGSIEEQALVANFYYGNPGDFGFMGVDCDGIDTPGSIGAPTAMSICANCNTQGVADVAFSSAVQ